MEGTGVIEVELPGVSEENVNLQVTEGKLSVSGERFALEFALGHCDKNDEVKEDIPPADGDSEKMNEEKTDDEASKESDQAEASTSFAAAPSVNYVAVFKLPPTADIGNSSAEYKNGLLSIRTPRQEAPSQTIEINL